MKPGRELDVLVEEIVIGQSVTYCAEAERMYRDFLDSGLISAFVAEGLIYTSNHMRVRNYSADIDAAFEILQRRAVKSFTLSKNLDGTWHCSIKFTDGRVSGGVELRGVSVAHAICLASLKAMRKSNILIVNKCNQYVTG